MTIIGYVNRLISDYSGAIIVVIIICVLLYRVSLIDKSVSDEAQEIAQKVAAKQSELALLIAGQLETQQNYIDDMSYTLKFLIVENEALQKENIALKACCQ